MTIPCGTDNGGDVRGTLNIHKVISDLVEHLQSLMFSEAPPGRSILGDHRHNLDLVYHKLGHFIYSLDAVT